MTALRVLHGSDSPAPSARPPLSVVRQSPCPCRDPDCRAQTMFADGHQAYKAAGLRCLTRCQANPGDIREHEDGTWQEMTSTRGWMPVRVVTVEAVDLDNGTIGNVRYTARMVGRRLEVVPLPKQSVTRGGRGTLLARGGSSGTAGDAPGRIGFNPLRGGIGEDMTQLALFAEPVKSSAQAVLPDSRWTYRWTKPGQAIRELRVKSCDGDRVSVCPTNFVDEAWPWTGRTLTATQLRKDWIQVQRRSPHAQRTS